LTFRGADRLGRSFEGEIKFEIMEPGDFGIAPPPALVFLAGAQNDFAGGDAEWREMLSQRQLMLAATIS
jgi:hypothetical protein